MKEAFVPKKTVYIKDSDVQLWDRAEHLAGEGSVSAVLTEALQQYLEGQKVLVGTVRFQAGMEATQTRVQPVSGGWLLAVPSGAPEDDGVQALRTAGIWPDRFPVPVAPPGQQMWVWVPPSSIAAIWVATGRTVGGVDFGERAREAWKVLRETATAGETLSYSELGDQLGGLHPYRQVPQVLDIIERWCLGHNFPDLTGVVVSRRSGLPGEDYWRQNGWGDLAVAARVDRWREAQRAMAVAHWPPTAPF